MNRIFELSGDQTALWSLEGPSVSCVTLGLGPGLTRKSLPWTANVMIFSSEDSENSVAPPLLKTRNCSLLDLSSALTSMASLRGVEPSCVDTTQRSAPHS